MADGQAAPGGALRTPAGRSAAQVVLAALLLAAPPAARAQEAGPSRDRLAAAYLRLEYLLRDHPPAAAALPAVHRAADRAGLAYLNNRGDIALHVLDSLASALEPDAATGAAVLRDAVRAVSASARRTRLLVAGGDTVPYQVHAPRAAAGPLPVLIALHGAGADERAFMEGIGAGRLRRLADARGFLAVTPLTERFMRDPARLDALLDTLGAAYPIDRSRVWLLGHSLGAIAAWRLATARPATVAAVVCIAGPCGGAPPDTSARWRAVPALVFAGALDPVATPERVERTVAAARDAGVPIELRVIPDRGHTLLAGGVLPDAVTWLATHRRSGTP